MGQLSWSLFGTLFLVSLRAVFSALAMASVGYFCQRRCWLSKSDEMTLSFLSMTFFVPSLLFVQTASSIRLEMLEGMMNPS